MNRLESFGEYLREEEKSELTREKYMRDVSKFLNWVNNRDLTKPLLNAYKAELTGCYAPASVNSMLSSVNCYLCFLGRSDCRVKILKRQQDAFLPEERELTREEYQKLLRSAGKDERLQLLMQAICATGIRVSEHRFLTVEALKEGKAIIRCKGKIRTVLIPRKLCKMLSAYCKKRGIRSGSIFITSGGKPLDRSRIWALMKKLCAVAKVSEKKVFPHNLRHLFARVHYSMEKDIVRLADILGHSSINTTRIYTRESGEVHRRQIEKMPLLYIT